MRLLLPANRCKIKNTFKTQGFFCLGFLLPKFAPLIFKKYTVLMWIKYMCRNVLLIAIVIGALLAGVNCAPNAQPTLTASLVVSGREWFSARIVISAAEQETKCSDLRRALNVDSNISCDSVLSNTYLLPTDSGTYAAMAINAPDGVDVLFQISKRNASAILTGSTAQRSTTVESVSFVQTGSCAPLSPPTSSRLYTLTSNVLLDWGIDPSGLRPQSIALASSAAFDPDSTCDSTTNTSAS